MKVAYDADMFIEQCDEARRLIIMNKNKKLFMFIGVILIAIVLVVLLLPFFTGNKDNVKVKDNVNIITSETETDFQPIKVTENTIFFKKDPKYKIGDVLVSGIIDSAPNGFIRKVVDIKEVNGIYEYETEVAVLIDVFEEAHIIKTFAVTDTQVQDIDEINNGVMTLNSVTTSEARCQELAHTKNSDANEQEASTFKIKPSENGLGVLVELNEKMGKNLEVSGKVEVNTYFELKIDIEDGDINFGMAIHSDTKGELLVGCQGELFDKDNSEGEYKKKILSKALPSINFFIGKVPIVITNDFELSAELSAQLEGQIGTSIGIDAERVLGFEYSSRTGDITEINEKKYFSDGIDPKTEAKASGELEAGIYAHLITKLYGSTGTDLAMGITGNLEGEIALGIDEKLESILYGKLDLSIGPKVTGKIVVTIPVVDYVLAETEIFKVTLSPFWEKTWEIPDPMLAAMQKGDFSCFAGRYVATPWDNYYWSGGDGKLDSLKLKKDGTVSGGGMDSRAWYPKTKPISVTKNEDGSYKCVWETGVIEDSIDESMRGVPYENYYIIYPVGVIGEKEVEKDQAYLKDVVYIYCEYTDTRWANQSGISCGVFYSDTIENVVVDYAGDDWVSNDAYTEEVGQQLISGTGIEYKVVATENNFDVGGGRTRTVLETKDGKRWMISNLPAFESDWRTGIIYFNIYEYESDPDYVVYDSI